MKEGIWAGELPMKNKKQLIEISKAYFKAFEEKNLDALKSMFTNDVSLIDWENNITGINNVIDFNKDIFSEHKSINVQIKNIFCSPLDNVALCNILIKLIKEEEEHDLSVIDILTFDSSGLIKQIKAQKSK